jgi:hypothetical protein
VETMQRVMQEAPKTHRATQLTQLATSVAPAE